MKKSWKKLLCSLMLAPCMFFATACGDDPEDPSNLTTDLTIEQQQEAYATLRTLASSVLNNDGTKDQSYILENTKPEFSENQLLEIAYTLEKASSHPLAEAVVNYCEKQKNIKNLNIKNFRNLFGLGIAGFISTSTDEKTEEKQYFAGNVSLVKNVLPAENLENLEIHLMYHLKNQ